MDVASPGISPRARRKCVPRKPRSINSTRVIVLLVIYLFVDSGYYTTLNAVLQLLGQDVQPAGTQFFATYLVPLAVPMLLYPVAGWVSDVHLGRHRTLQASLWTVGAGQFAAFVLFYILTTVADERWVDEHRPTVAGLTVVIYALVNVGLAGLLTNIVPFCVDQMVDASGEQLSAFLHWYYWTQYVRSSFTSVLSDCLWKADLKHYTVLLGVNVLLMGLALLFWHLWNARFVVEPRGSNPLRTVCGVLSFAGRHRYPLYQSALTSRRPSRLELSKRHFGGPFTSEEVEDVRSFFRVLVVLLSLGSFIIVDYAVAQRFSAQINSRYLIKKSMCSLNILLQDICENAVVLLGIPIHEFIVYPLLCKGSLTTLQRMGIGMLLATASMLSFLTIDLVGHMKASNSVSCFLNSSTLNNNTTLPISSYSLTAPFLFGTLADIFIYIAAYEFICAQSPYNMRGMLFGVFYSIEGLFAVLSGTITLALTYGYRMLRPTCGTFYYALMTFMIIVGFILLLVAASKYKLRKHPHSSASALETTSESSLFVPDITSLNSDQGQVTLYQTN